MQATDLLRELDRGVSTATQLAARCGVSRPTLSRALAPLLRAGQVFAIGAARSTRYARVSAQWPVYRIGAGGEVLEFGTLRALAAGQYYLQQLTTGLPYFLQDQRPAGFLGRFVPQRHPELRLPPRVADWTDEHYLRWLTEHGWDAVGDLIVGEAALNRFLAWKATPVKPAERPQRYAQLADAAVAGGAPGSSAHGEHPKFAVALAHGRRLQHCLVKFSPPRSTPLGQRWSDLLVAEQHAHVCLRRAGIAACESELLLGGSRTYLEVQRFDRAGARGRRGVCSLLAIDAASYGQLDDWAAAAQRLARDGRLGNEDLRRVRFLSAFGALIGNTDRHFGNLAFFDDCRGGIRLAPAYDMLPMLFAPQNEQLVAAEFLPPAATAATVSVWPAALALARDYWRELAADARLSREFRRLCARCLRTLTPPT